MTPESASAPNPEEEYEDTTNELTGLPLKRKYPHTPRTLPVGKQPGEIPPGIRKGSGRSPKGSKRKEE